MLDLAYCYETNSKVTAQNAYTSGIGGLHFFCPQTNCCAAVHPRQSKRKNGPGIYYYTANPGSHDEKCIHFHEPEVDVDRGEPKPGPATPINIPIPTVLGSVELKPRKIWKPKPDRQELVKLIESANLAPLVIYGNLEEVVTAWESINPQVRSQHSLEILGTNTNYAAAFIHLMQQSDVISTVDFNKIVYGMYMFKPGDNPRYFFCTSLKGFLASAEKKSKMSLTVGPSDYQPVEKRYVPGVLARENGTLFWHGSAPVNVNGRYRFTNNPADPYKGFAVRAHIYGIET